jgi:REP element-mobilizing transposase RayT
MRTVREVGNLRRGYAYRAVRRALRTTAARADFRVVHISIQGNHLHLIVEADDQVSLARGMQGFASSAARKINRDRGAAPRRRGRVFAHRYHATHLTSPTQVRHVIRYVLNNWRRHGEDRDHDWRVDPFSSAHAFDGWREAYRGPPHRDPLPVVRATTWLLLEGWRRAGPPISVFAKPGRPAAITLA